MSPRVAVVRRRRWIEAALSLARPSLAVPVGAGLLLSACRGPVSALDPAGPNAAQIADLWWLMFWLAAFLYVAVLVTVAYVLLARRPDTGEPPREGRRGELALIVLGGIAVPAIVLGVILVATLRTGSAVSAAPVQPELTVEIVGHQFWWEIRYPDQEFSTANEMHIPVGRPIRVDLRAADVIHSFSVPRLRGKMDLIPGQTNTISLEASEPGIYRGVCAEFCGVQHAQMHFLVVVEPADQFAAWLDRQRRPAEEPAEPLARTGRELFGSAGCALCHNVRGSGAGVGPAVGPDLTHLASRMTIAAAMLPNEPAVMARWVSNPDALKPGVRMPPTSFDPDQLEAVVAYLSSLR